MQTITITGNLGKSVSIKTLPSGKTISNLSVASTPRVKQNGEWVDGETMWFSVSIWGSLPEAAFPVGANLLITGQLSQRSYEKDGVTKQALNINADSVAIVYRPVQPDQLASQITDPNQATRASDWGSNLTASADLDNAPF